MANFVFFLLLFHFFFSRQTDASFLHSDPIIWQLLSDQRRSSNVRLSRKVRILHRPAGPGRALQLRRIGLPVFQSLPRSHSLYKNWSVPWMDCGEYSTRKMCIEPSLSRANLTLSTQPNPTQPYIPNITKFKT